MFGSKVLEVGVGLSLLFLFVSLICTAIREMIEAVMKSRAMDLERGIRTLLNSPTGTSTDAGDISAEDFYGHPLVYALFKGDYDPGKLITGLKSKETATFKSRLPVGARGNMPSYIPAAQFAGALFDILAHGPVGDAPDPSAPTMPVSIKSLRQSVAKIADPKLQRALLAAIDAAQGDLDKVKTNLEQWYNGTMDRVAGWYKRRTQVILLLLGFGAAVFFNIDAITIANSLVHEQKLQSSVFEHADKLIAASTKPGADANLQSEVDKTSTAELTKLTQALADVDYPIGWEDGWPKPQAKSLGCEAAPDTGQSTKERYANCKLNDLKVLPALSLLLGWIVTALAVTLGAPFWFDVLNRFMVIRSTVKPHEKSRQEGSKDARDAAAPAARKPSENGDGGNGDGGDPEPGGDGSGAPTPADGALAGLAAFQTTLPFEPHQWAAGNPLEGVI